MNSAAPTSEITADVHRLIRVRAAASSDAADTVFAVLSEAGVNTASLSLDDWKTIVVEAVVCARHHSAAPQRAA